MWHLFIHKFVFHLSTHLSMCQTCFQHMIFMCKIYEPMNQRNSHLLLLIRHMLNLWCLSLAKMLKSHFNSLSKIGVVKAYFIWSMNLYNIKFNILPINSLVSCVFITSENFNITKIWWNLCENCKTICFYKIHGIQNVKMAWKCFFFKYINDMSFLLMMFWCDGWFTF